MKENFETEFKINISDNERITLRRIDNVVDIYVEEDLSGIVRKLAFYDLIKRKWEGHNPHNFRMWFNLCRKYKFISPKIIRYLSTPDTPQEIKQIKKTFTCFKRRISITVNKAIHKTRYYFNG